MKILNDYQITGLRTIRDVVFKDRLKATLNRLFLPSTGIIEKDNRFFFLTTQTTSAGESVMDIFTDDNSKLYQYVILISTIKQLKEDGYIILFDTGKKREVEQDLNTNEPTCGLYEIIDNEIVAFLKNNFYKSIILTNELLDYIETGKTKERILFEEQLADTQKKHDENMEKVSKSLYWSRAAFVVALVTSLFGISDIWDGNKSAKLENVSLNIYKFVPVSVEKSIDRDSIPIDCNSDNSICKK